MSARVSGRAKKVLAGFLPAFVIKFLDGAVFRLRRRRIRAIRALFARFGYNIVHHADYYSTLPVLEEIEKTRDRWDKPSDLPGVEVDPDVLLKSLMALADDWEAEFAEVGGDYLANTQRGFGPGYPAFDARTLYYMLREHKPARYLEVGSGLSTFYASLAAERNAAEGSPMQMTCIEPYPFEALGMIPGIGLVEDFVQAVPLSKFQELEPGDVLFIDSSHAFKIDSDVAYLFLDVLPRLRGGVHVHIHDVPFPYNTPYPADTWLFGERWPVYWNEAMLVQAFLAFNDAFELRLSTPMVRHHQEMALTRRFKDYLPVTEDPNPPSSLWLLKTR